MQTTEDLLHMYRRRLREILEDVGIMPNHDVTDEWILDNILSLIPQPPTITINQIPEPLSKIILERLGWNEEEAKLKILRTQEILGLDVNEAIRFLLYEVITGVKIVICDGCDVEQPFEHRCHNERAVVRGEQKDEKCLCVNCFIGRL